MNNNAIAIASDHGAFDLKEKLKERLKKLGYETVDMGTHSAESVDYPDFAIKVAKAVGDKTYQRGILLCGTGIGMSIAANKISGVRAAIVYDNYTAKMSRMHNNCNILVLGGRTTGEETAYDILETWLNTPYEGGRHDKRINKISELDSSRINSSASEENPKGPGSKTAGEDSK
ncbi:MAG: ribose 5-phosphate isomerase B [Nitrospinota bacterium]|nr:ribose 5-phosphate isomerase B [Nitrospinota bacterium]MDH5678585.1 ribose 5-phosphate isomerase B [Nitrospinota bacterium]MDH5757301.1 ribose 5-phosphate isomerase B [Nitrospinota bacterium]